MMMERVNIAYVFICNGPYFLVCHYTCKECNGPDDNNCTECDDANSRSLINLANCICLPHFYDNNKPSCNDCYY